MRRTLANVDRWADNSEVTGMTIQRLVGVAAIIAPILHVMTDVQEWQHGGFSDIQLWLNYAAFLPMPALMVGLYAMQRPQVGRAGLWGALLYGGAFIYFAHTTLLALAESTPDYATLWHRLGRAYSAHGVVMIVGGLMFGWATWHAAVMPRLGAALFVCGLLGNLMISLMPVPDLLQTIGSGVRNAGLIVMGWHLSRARKLPQATNGRTNKDRSDRKGRLNPY